MIKLVPNIILDGQIVNPYSVDFTSGGNDVSKLSLTFVDRTGDYDLTNRFQRNSNRIISISIGNFFKFSGYIVGTDASQRSSGGSILKVDLSDSSIILDKYFIGLKGVYGAGFSTIASGTFSNIILVGKQVDPCVNLPPNAPDPCAPFCGDSETQETFNCQEEKAMKILEVNYSFPELKSAVAGVVKFGSFPAGVNTQYRSNYTGNLRDVLKSWCQDFGIDFYWENNAIYFFDARLGRQINTSNIDVQTVISTSQSFSIEGNYTLGNLVYFGGEGEKREYSCTRDSNSKRFTLRPITIYDILEDNTDSNGNPGYAFLTRNYDPHLYRLGNATRSLFDSIVLSYYSDVIRDLYQLFEVEGLDSVLNMIAFINNPSKKPIPALGGLRPRKIFYSPKPGLPVQDNLYANVYKTLVSRMTPNEAVDFDKRGGYFIVADYNKERHDLFLNFENKLAEDLVGKYWFRGGVDGENYSFDAPDASPTFYSNGSEIQFPFLDALPVDIVRSSDFITESLAIDDPTNPDKTHGKFLIVERTPAWVPNKTSDSIQRIIQELVPYSMEVVGSEDINGENFLDAGQVFIKVLPRPKGLDLKIYNHQKEENNPFDAKNVGRRGEVGGIISGYGLLSSLTTSFVLKTPASSVKIFMPSQAGKRFGTEYGGYTVFANGQQFTNNITRIIPKAEFILGSVPASTDKDVGLQIQYRDATQNLVDLFANNGDTCGYNKAKILGLLQNFNSRYYTPASVERETRSYTIFGIPEFRFTALDGLQSFTLNYEDSGVTTTLSFSNLPEAKPSEAIVLEEFKKANTILKKAAKYFKQK